MKSVEIKLACGHWSMPMPRNIAEQALSSRPDLIPCRASACDGGPIDEPESFLLAGQRVTSIMPTPGAAPMRRRDGLWARFPPGGHIMWHCRLCDGKRPEHWRGLVRTREELFDQWDVHRQSSTHLRHCGDEALAERVAQAIDPNRRLPPES